MSRIGLRNHLNALYLRKLEETPRICFCHVPKCAGNSIVNAIKQQSYSWLQRALFLNLRIDLKASHKAATLFSRTMMEIRQEIMAYSLASTRYKFIAGHVYCKPAVVSEFNDEWGFVTILRDPVDRWVSAFVYDTYKEEEWFNNRLPLNNYLETPAARENGITYLRYFSNYEYKPMIDSASAIDQAVDNLKHFRVVGIIEELDSWCASFETAFGVRLRLEVMNSSPSEDVRRSIMEDRSAMQKIEALCRPDIEIYNRIKTACRS